MPGEGSETEPYYYVYGYEGTDVASAQATGNFAFYGVLYNWPAVMTEGICPSGWHIPSDEEFTELTDFLGGEAVAGFAMKSAIGWNGTNSSGWSGLPGGYRYSGGFDHYGLYGYWWSASVYGNGSRVLGLISSNDDVYGGSLNHFQAYSARCVRD